MRTLIIKFDIIQIYLYNTNKINKNFRYAGTALWNNMLEPEGHKALNWKSPVKKFLCPSKENPYIYTYDNS